MGRFEQCRRRGRLSGAPVFLIGLFKSWKLFQRALPLAPYRRNTLSKRPICSVTMLIACSVVTGRTTGAPAVIDSSCLTAEARCLRVSANNINPLARSRLLRSLREKCD
jgi:hypothetical protein